MRKNEKHKRAFLVWLGIYPLITLLFYCLGDRLAGAPVFIRTLILTLIAVPILFYGILPFYNRFFSTWLNR